MTETEHESLAAVLPRYEIHGVIGRGGWGVVYEGRHRDLQRPVAIKQLPRSLGADPAVRDRFIAEAQRVAGLEHPHIVPVYDFAERDGLYVIVMELATGSVWDRFEQSGLLPEQAIGTVLASAVGLHYAHSRGLLHRDVKPDNMLYSASGTVKIADFGIAKSMSETGGARTATNMVVGSPSYMAPEQISIAPLSPATDVYALGVVTYQLLSGHLPFAPTEEALAQLYQHVHETPRDLHQVAPHVPAPLVEVIHRALLKDAAERPQTAEQFAVELATAATESFGSGWLERTGLAVMGSTPVIAATERSLGAAARPSGTLVIRPDDLERRRHAAAESGVMQRSAQPAAPADHPATEGGGRRVPMRLLIGALAALVALIVAVVVLTGGGGDPASSDPITDAERSTFRSLCEQNGVGAERCGCALDRAATTLDPPDFRDSLAVMVEQNGALDAELQSIFESCVADGF